MGESSSELDFQLTQAVDQLAASVGVALGLVDEPGSDGMIRLLIPCTLNVRIEIFPNEQNHNYPHFKASVGDENATYKIEDGMRLAGSIRRKVEKRIQEWARENQTLLMDKWNLTRPTDVTGSYLYFK